MCADTYRVSYRIYCDRHDTRGRNKSRGELELPDQSYYSTAGLEPSCRKRNIASCRMETTSFNCTVEGLFLRMWPRDAVLETLIVKPSAVNQPSRGIRRNVIDPFSFLASPSVLQAYLACGTMIVKQ